jgi:hypothetical protein
MSITLLCSSTLAGAIFFSFLFSAGCSDAFFSTFFVLVSDVSAVFELPLVFVFGLVFFSSSTFLPDSSLSSFFFSSSFF